MNKLFSCDFPFLALYYFALYDNNEILSGDFGAWFDFFYCFSEGEEMALQTQNELLLRLISKIRRGLSHSFRLLQKSEYC